MMTKGNLALLGIAIVAIGLFLFGAYTNSQKERNTASSDEYIPDNAPILIAESEQLYKDIDNDRQYLALRNDLTHFRRISLSEPEKHKTVFTIQSDIRKNNEFIEFEGVFDGVPGVVAVRIKKLNNDRLNSSITNKSSGLNIDEYLPSNSRRNQFIGSLPIKGEGFSISYLVDSDSFYVALDAPADQAAAVKELKDKLGVASLESENVSFVTWDTNGNPKSLPNPDAAR